MYEIYFDNSEIIDATGIRMCLCPDFQSAIAVYDSLTRRFCCVNLYDSKGDLIRKHTNL